MIHTSFEDRLAAGRCLAHELAFAGISPDAIVIAVARGGVPVGYEVADRLHLALDVVAARRIEVPWQREITIGAVAGTETVLDDELIKTMGISSCELADIVPTEIGRAGKENDLYHRHSRALDICGRPVIVVDDGLDTGDTMLAAVPYVRRLQPGLLIAAAPVGRSGAFARLRNEADRVINVESQDCFCTVGEHFRDFDQVGAPEIEKLLLASRRQQLRTNTMKASSESVPLTASATGPHSRNNSF
jgi:predicted phosphoribosyltransferase